MREEFLHYLWKYRLYDEVKLIGNDGATVEIVSPGEYNRDAGPDFFNARIRIDGIIWAGNVEVHSKASHFTRHGHNTDRLYDNIVLHIVDEYDKSVRDSSGREVPAAIMDYDPLIYEKYLGLISNPYAIACQKEITGIDRFAIDHWLGALTVERLMGKSDQIYRMLAETGNDWEEVLYRLLFICFGLKINSGIFELLARSLPYKLIRKHADDPVVVEALLFGTAGLLEEELYGGGEDDGYRELLVREYKVFSSKYSLKPVHGWLWKFARLRPANFPTVRIAQLASLYAEAGGLFSRVVECDDLKEIRKLFDLSASSYWDKHYTFGMESPAKPKKLGAGSIDLLLINAVIPVMFVCGAEKNDERLREKALMFLEGIRPEDNRIIREWKRAGIPPRSAFRTQALIQLRNNYCGKKRCLDCRIGKLIIGQGKSLMAPSSLALEP